MTILQRLQNSWLTSWLWAFWCQKGTGLIVMLPIWKNPGKGWYKARWKN